ncbi:ribosomal RNA processing protein 36 homolog [Anarrhichthys ocellatus]|uniref:ribosomal RNA processing protein 36 homolog n=1 Tax=Anarrhichthys ocellatus TaxID=433405 RepID=UPI0012EE266D|nr:ribosomal RNA processing protein 36 homolog [Anarrhichthys ocellatus]
MKGKEKQRRDVKVSEKKNMAASSSSSGDEDSDVERNFALLTERGRVAEVGEPHHGGEEEEEVSEEDEEEEGSDGGAEEEEEEEEEGGEEGSDGGEEEEEDEDSEASEEDVDEGPEVAGGSSEVQMRDDMKKELSIMSFEEVMKLQNQVGTKVYNEVAYGSNKTQASSRKKRLNKNRPMEISAKRRAPFLRQVVSVRKPTSRDPRFDDLSGEYKPEIFEKTFKFINDIKQREREIVQKQLKKTKKSNVQKKEKLEFLLKRMDNQERARKNREQQRERELQFKRQQRERANQGARPFFLKNSDKKKLQLAEKYQELKKSGKLESFLGKKRKRNAGKDRRKLPRQLENKNVQ